jgi:general secretion pathway protein L
MSLLVLLLPAKPRQHPSRDNAPSPAASVAEIDFALANDRRGLREAGRAAPALVPGRSATEIVAVLPDQAVSWHRITVPKAPAGRLRGALVGVMEEALLDEPDQVHFALEPGAEAGQEAWVAATDKAWLAGQLAALEGAGLMIDKVVPLSWPGAHMLVHLETAEESADIGPADGDAGAQLIWAHQDGVMKMPVTEDGQAALTIDQLPEDTRVHATPAAAVLAERWARRPVTIVRAAERWLWSARGPWNLRQFDLAPSRRGLAQLRSAWSAVRSPAWRPVRWGLVGLLLVQLIGLNVAAWRQRSELAQVRADMTQILRSTHPQVSAILDAPLQMQRETDTLRAQAGQPGEGDLEPLLASIASAWPGGQPVQGLRFEPGQVTVSTNGLPPVELERVEQALRSAGLQIELIDGRLSVRPPRNTPGATP